MYKTFKNGNIILMNDFTARVVLCFSIISLKKKKKLIALYWPHSKFLWQDKVNKIEIVLRV